MKRLRWQLLVVAISLIAIAFLLFGQQPEYLPGSEPVIEPTRGGVYTEALIGSVNRLNPMLDYYNQADYDVNRLLFSSLVKFNDRGLPYGDLAETWGQSVDGSGYSFSIRADAVWHDGQPVTSNDVLYTIESLRSEDIPMPADIHEFWQQVDVQILDDKTIRFELPEPFAPFLDYLTFGILPEHLLGHLFPDQIIDAPFNLQPIGSGPYYFDSFLTEDDQITGVVLKAFDDYYGDTPFIDQIVFKYTLDTTSAFFSYKQGDVMGISQVSQDVLDDVLTEPNLQVFSSRLPRLNLIYLNLQLPEKPFFQETEVRRALMMGINRRWILDRLLGGQAIPAHGPIFPENWAYYDGIEKIEFDPQAAVDILKSAGYTIPAEGGSVREKDGVFLSFEMVYPDAPPYDEIAESIRADWARLGVQVDLQALPYEELRDDYLQTRLFEAALVELNMARSPDPDPYPFWHQAQAVQGQNYSGWDDRRASEYLERARIRSDFEERLRLYRNFQVRFAAELPALPLFYPVYNYTMDNQMQGVSVGPLFDPSDRFENISSWFLVAGLSESEQTSE